MRWSGAFRVGAWVAGIAVLAIAIGLQVGPPRPVAADSTFLNETFTDGANNWNPASGDWGVTAASHYTNCHPGGSCDNTGIDRSWIGVASNASAYTIDADIWMMGSSQECKIIYTGANNNDDYRVDIMHETNQVRVSAPYPSIVQTWTPNGAHAPIADGGAYYHLRLAVTRGTVSVSYKQGNETLDPILSLGTNIYPDGKIGVGTYAADCEFTNVAVSGSEGVGSGTARLIPVFGYERTEACNEGPDNPNKPGEVMTERQCDRPLFTPWNRDDQAWWTDQVEELDHAGITTIAAHNRGCWSTSPTEMHGSGDMCPNQLSKLVTAINLRGSAMKVSMFDDFPTVGDQYYSVTGQNFDMSNASLWQTYMWQDRWNIFYANIPRSLDGTISGRPLVFMWDPVTHFTNLQGNLSRALDYLRSQTQATYGFDPFIAVTQGFYNADTTLPGHVDAVFSWYDPSQGTGTLPAARYGGYTAATVAPSLRSWPQNTGPGCGSSCLEVPRWHGNGLISYLDQQKATNLVLLEGWTNVIESAGYYRSVEGNDPHGCTQAGDQNTIDYPNQSLNIVQRYSNPNRTSVTLEAEAADDYYTGTSGNLGGAYRVTSPANSGCASTYNDLSVGQVGGTYQYFVGWVNPGVEWFRFKDVYLPAGTYRLDVRYATPNTNATICVTVNGAPQQCSGNLVPTGSWTTFATATIGTISLHKGLSSFKVFIAGPGQLNVDNLAVHT
ncbi:MAG: DUF5010 domain-containing protein [Candidatus Dormibacteraceae bacterium]